MTDKLQINNVIEAVLEEHVAATRSQRVQIRELLLDAIERAGFIIVGKPNPVHPHSIDKVSIDYTPVAFDDEDLQSLMDRDRE